jgi:hypothetical protein
MNRSNTAAIPKIISYRQKVIQHLENSFQDHFRQRDAFVINAPGVLADINPRLGPAKYATRTRPRRSPGDGSPGPANALSACAAEPGRAGRGRRRSRRRSGPHGPRPGGSPAQASACGGPWPGRPWRGWACRPVLAGTRAAERPRRSPHPVHDAQRRGFLGGHKGLQTRLTATLRSREAPYAEALPQPIQGSRRFLRRQQGRRSLSSR